MNVVNICSTILHYTHYNDSSVSFSVVVLYSSVHCLLRSGFLRPSTYGINFLVSRGRYSGDLCCGPGSGGINWSPGSRSVIQAFVSADPGKLVIADPQHFL